MNDIVLNVENLCISFLYNKQYYPVTRDVSFEVHKGEIFGLVGESGSGKSVTAKCILRLLPKRSSEVTKGRIIYDGKDILQLPLKEMYRIRGNNISMVFQEPMTSLNPVFKCGDQIIETIELHQKVSRSNAYKMALDMLKLVSIPMPERRMNNYPHELSGGMRQRIMIAMALACRPTILLADEPTTALDPTIQAQIMELLKKLRDELQMAILLISHDMAVIAENCDTVAVMYAGVVMEIADVYELFENPIHPYTKGLLACIPDIKKEVGVLTGIPGYVPHMSEISKGCPFCTRCKFSTELCCEQLPSMRGTVRHKVRCHHFGLTAAKEVPE